MAPKKVAFGLLNYYIPTGNPKIANSVPARLHKLAAPWDGSFWIYSMAVDAEIGRIVREYDGIEGSRFHRVRDWTAKDPAEIEKIVRDALTRTVGEIAKSLKGSTASLRKKFDQMDSVDADGKIVDRVRDAQRKLKDVATVIASFALTEDYDEMREVVNQQIEAELVAARSDLMKVTAKKMGV
jgi:hypothetical protein